MRHLFSAIHRLGGAPTLHVFYHLVTDEPAPHVAALYPVRSVQQFRADLDWLLQHFVPVTLDEVGSTAGRVPGFHLSFDDGLRQCYDTVLPILLEKGVPATFFVNPSFVDNRALMYRYTASLMATQHPDLRTQVLGMGYQARHLLEQLAADSGIDVAAFLRDYAPYMTLAQIQSLSNLGFTVGAHSMDHPMYAQESEAVQLRQTLDSIEWVRAQIGVQHPPFAFPFTDWGVSERLFGQLPPETLSFGCAGLKQERLPRHFQRLALEKTTRHAAWTVSMAYGGYLVKRLLGRHVAQR